jgi:hypothetical protein
VGPPAEIAPRSFLAAYARGTLAATAFWQLGYKPSVTQLGQLINDRRRVRGNPVE